MKKSTATIVQWIIGALFLTFVFVYELHWTSLLMLCAGVLMLPIPPIRHFLQKFYIKNWIAIMLSAILTCIAILNTPTTDTNQVTPSVSSSFSNDRAHGVSISNNFPSSDSSVFFPENSGVIIVWISTSGNKYHRKSTCSNMQHPQKIDKEQAVAKGYTDCKKCY